LSLCSNCKILTIATKEKSFVKLNDRNRAVGIATRLRAGRSGVPISVGACYFSLLQNVWTGSGAHLATYPMGTGFISRAKRPWVRLTSRLAHRLTIREAIPLIRLYAIMAFFNTFIYQHAPLLLSSTTCIIVNFTYYDLSCLYTFNIIY
jgi:hypothetical protein